MPFLQCLKKWIIIDHSITPLVIAYEIVDLLTILDISTIIKTAFDIREDEALKHYDECYFVNYDSYEDLRLAEIGCQKCPSKYSFGPIIRENYVLHYILEGSGSLFINKKEFRISAKQAFFTPPHLPAYYIADEKTPWNYIWIHFNGTKAFEFLNAIGISAQQPVFIPVSPDDELESCMRYFLLHYEQELLCIGNLYHLFHHLIDVSSTKPKPGEQEIQLKYITDIVNYIHTKFNEPIKVSDIAEYCGLDRSYLSKIFKQATNYSPQEYLIIYRIRKAQEYLLDPNFSIQNVAFAVGYPDPFAFSKVFKKNTGMSPSEYRASHLKTGS